MQDAIYLAKIPITVKEGERGVGKTFNNFCHVQSVSQP